MLIKWHPLLSDSVPSGSAIAALSSSTGAVATDLKDAGEDGSELNNSLLYAFVGLSNHMSTFVCLLCLAGKETGIAGGAWRSEGIRVPTDRCHWTGTSEIIDLKTDTNEKCVFGVLNMFFLSSCKTDIKKIKLKLHF